MKSVPPHHSPAVSTSEANRISADPKDQSTVAGRVGRPGHRISAIRTRLQSVSTLPCVICAVILACAGASDAAVPTFEDLTLDPESFWNGADGAGGFVSGAAAFGNSYNAEWDFWDGFAYSNRTDPNATGLDAQYNAMPGSGQGGSANYAVGFVGWEAPPTMTFAEPQRFTGLYVTNNCYAYYDMRDGGLFSKRFGGQTGDDPDWFKLTVTGLDANDLPTGKVEFYLADFRFDDNTRDYILNSWAFVDLTSLGEVQALQFTLSSSDTGDFGMNTPGYFCLDTVLPQFNLATFEDLPLEPESSWNGADGSGGFVSGAAAFGNSYNAEWDFWDGFAYSNRTDPNGAGLDAQYNAIAGSGQGGSATYAVGFVGWEAPPTMTFGKTQRFTGLYVTNNCYAYYDLRDGGPFSKRFGGQAGDDPDWFKLTITGLDANDLPTGEVEFYLADFRFEDNTRDYILDSWAFVDLTSLGEVQALQFTLSSSDTGDFGMNTPGYFCLDTVVTATDSPDTASKETPSEPPETEQPSASTGLLPGGKP